ncbi:unnamed protein product [Cylicostephanus goldi]|uniref:Uncharacterized protein n=1 Tax=Cylicostephanus goldi TaxID=71465 RepID=A0A3P6U3I6_CYLGO|nr:unnamed protein product [Cylicostephanus goldi]
MQAFFSASNEEEALMSGTLGFIRSDCSIKISEQRRKYWIEEKHIKKICRLIASLTGDRKTLNWSVVENKV